MKQIMFCATDKDELEKGINKVKEQIGKAYFSSLIFHMYCGITDEEPILFAAKTLQDAFKDAIVIGTASNSEIMNGYIIDRDILV